MGAVADLAATVRAKVTDLNRTVAGLYAVRAMLEQARHRLDGAARGAERPGLAEATRMTARAADRADQASILIMRAAEALAYYSTTAMGFPLSPTGGTETRQTSRPSAMPTAPDWVRQVAVDLRQLLPRGSKTAGVLTTADGRTRSKPIWSGAQGPAAGGSGLRRDDTLNQWHRLKSAVEHVEGHAAAVMRRPNGPKDAVLVVSVPPCPGPYGCNTILPALLPAESNLSVYVVGADGQPRFWRTYRGTGEGTTG